ncbi:MAG: DUF177 domain-containing protein [Roseiflexaceae bacterium]
MSRAEHDLKFNVAQLLREPIGATRSYTFDEDRITLDETLTLRSIVGKVRFTRTASGVLADLKAKGQVEMECTRCLKPAQQTVEISFYDEFHSRIEVHTGMALPLPNEEDPFYIDELHMLDVGEAIREYALMELPMRPLCKPDCKGLCPQCGVDRNVEQCQCEDGVIDERLAALRALLN